MKNMKIEVPEGYTLVKNENNGYDLVKEPFDYHTIKTFVDARKKLGDEHPFVRVYDDAISSDAVNDELAHSADLIAYLQLRIIVAAINDGWEPQFIKGEYRYYPWFDLYTKEELDDMDDDKKGGLLLWGARSNNGSLAGLASAYSNPAFSVSSAVCGSRLAYKTREMAIYAGKQFIKIYAKYLLP